MDILFFCLFGRFDTANIPTLDISFVSFALPYRGLDSTLVLGYLPLLAWGGVGAGLGE